MLVFVWYMWYTLSFIIFADFCKSLKNIRKKHFDITCFLLFRNKNEPVFVLQNQQGGTFKKFNKNNSGIIDLHRCC